MTARTPKMELISSKEKHRNEIFTVTEDHAVDPEGFEIKRAIIQHGGSAVMMPVEDNKVLLVRQYRLPARAYLWEIPAGRVDRGETVLHAAKRELREETGYRASRWTRIGEFYVSPGFLAEKMTVFVAEHLTAGEQHLMEDERIEIRWFTQGQIDELIRKQKMNDAKTMLAFLLWKRYHGASRAQRMNTIESR